MLKYITKGGCDPQGKPRVYVCCHPQEQSSFLQYVADMLLKTQNCAIWYTEDPNGPRDPDFWADLQQMQLFVMSVTGQLLNTKNPAMEEFRFAMEKHIPVLPLMQESGLEALFNQKCGDLQFLDPNMEDSTAIRYEEKLEKFLSAVLIGDELAEKVRAAFDAYVFLSYRKKDRRYARELMRLIHRNPNCRDIAIWYDEYLTPGEDFNDAIRAALKKCNLFALAVTPSLLEKVPDQAGLLRENYVAAHEYPLARESKKPILPVQMQPTDRAALEQVYEAIPHCVDGQDQTALTDAVIGYLRQVALGINDNDPAHNYLIGLAYLNGIDVEVDYPQAAALIRSAAEAQLPEAMDRLAQMYRVGLGVERDFKTALHWQEQTAAALEKEYKAESTEDRFDALFWALVFCGDGYAELGEENRAIAYYESARQYTQEKDTVRDRWLSVVLQRLADLYEARGDWKLARDYLETSLRIQEAACRAVADVETLRYLAIGYERWGDISRKNGDIETARHFFESAKRFFEQLANQLGSDGAMQDLGVICNRLGDICLWCLQLSEAKAYYQRSLQIRETLAEKICGQDARVDSEVTPHVLKANLATCYEKMGDISKAEDDLESAKAYYVKSLEMRLALVAETGFVQHKRDLRVSYLRMGSLADSEEARVYSCKALEITDALVEETQSVQAYIDRLEVLVQLAESWEEEELSVAREYYNMAAETCEMLLAISDAPTVRMSCMHSFTDLAQACKNLGDMDGTFKNLHRSAEIGEELIKDYTDESFVLNLASVNLLLGNFYEDEEGDTEAAIHWYHRGMTLSVSLLRNGGTLEQKRMASLACRLLGNAYGETEKFEQAQQLLSAAIGIADEMAQESGAAADAVLVSENYVELGDLFRDFGETEEAVAQYKRGLDRAAELVENSAEPEISRQIAEVYHKLAEVYMESGSLVDVELCYRQSIAAMTLLVREDGDLDDWETLAMDCSNAAYACKAQGKMDEAKSLYQRCLQIRQMTARESGTAEAWDRLGRTFLKLVLADEENAEEYLHEAAVIYQALTRAVPYDPQYRQLMESLEEYL